MTKQLVSDIVPTYRLVSEGLSSQGVRLVDEAGKELKHLTSIDVHFRVDSLVTAEVGLLGLVAEKVDIAEAAFTIQDPFDKSVHRVKRIEFEDGSGYEVMYGKLIKFDAQC